MSESGELRRDEQVAGGAGILFLGTLVGSVLALVHDVMVNGALGNEAYGAFSTVRRVLQFGFVLVLFGTENAVVRWVARAQGRGDPASVRGTFQSVLLVAGLLSCLVGGAVWLSAVPLANAIDPELGDAFRWVAIALPLWCIRMVAVCTSQGLLMLSHRALVCNVLWPAGNVAGVWLLCMVLDWGLEGALLSLDLSMLLGVIVALVLLARARPDVMSRSADTTWDLAGIAKFSAPLWAYSVVHWIFAWSDQVLVAALGGMSAAGAYGPVANLAPLFALGLTALNGVFAPVISELHSSRQMDELARLYRTVTRWALVLTLPGVLLALGAPDRIIALWPAGQEEAWNALRLIAAAQLIATAVGSVNFLLIMSGHQHHVLYSGLPAIALNLGLCYLLIPEHGVMGAATANAVATAAANLLALGQVWYLLRMHPFHPGLLKPVVGAAVALPLVLLVAPWVSGLPALLGLAILGAMVVTVLGLVMVGLGLDDDDLALLTRLSSKFRR